MSEDASGLDSVPYGLRLKHGLTLSGSFDLDDLQKALIDLRNQLTRDDSGICRTHVASDSIEKPKVLPRDGKVRPRILRLGSPQQVIEIYGRKAEIERCAALLQRFSVALVGIQGIGKSSVAAAVFKKLRESSRDQFDTCIWVSFYYLNPPSFTQFAHEVVTALTGKSFDFESLPIEEQVAALCQELRRARALLIIDQFECVIDLRTNASPDRGFALLLQSMREGLGKARLLVTSWIVPQGLDGLPITAVVLDRITDQASFDLLRDQDPCHSAGIVDKDEPDSTIKELIGRMQGQPLALKWVALNKHDILDELLKDETLWENLLKEVAPLVFEKIYERIKGKRTVLATLRAVCILADGCTVDGAAQVTKAPRHEIVEAFNHLSKRGVVHTLSDVEASVRRYDVHALVRDYVLQKIAKKTLQSFHRHAANYYLSMSTSLSADDGKTLANRAKVLQGIDHLIFAGRSDSAFIAIDEYELHDVLYRGAYWTQLTRLYGRIDKRQLEPQELSVLLGRLGLCERDLQEFAIANDHYEKGLGIALRHSDQWMECYHRINLGDLYFYQGKPKESIEQLEHAYTLASKLDAPHLESRNLGCLGNALASSDDIRAENCYLRAIELCKQIGDRRYEGIWLGDLGLIFSRRGDNAKALECFERAFNIAKDVGDTANQSLWLAHSGTEHLALGNADIAIGYFESAVRGSLAIRDKRKVLDPLNRLLSITYSRGELPRFTAFLKEVCDREHACDNEESDIEWTRDVLQQGLAAVAEGFLSDRKYADAEEALSDVIHLAPNLPKAYASRGMCRRVLAFDSPQPTTLLQSAIQDYQKAIDLEPEHDGHHMLLAACAAQNGDFSTALAGYTSAIELNPANIQVMLGKLELEICIDQLEQAIATSGKINLELCTSVERVILAALSGVAQALTGRDSTDCREVLRRTDQELSETTWCLVEIDQYLLKGSRRDPINFAIASDLWGTFKSLFTDHSIQ